MPDLARMGGVTGWKDAASLAAANNVAMSSHLFPEVSAHLLAATPTADWLEYVDWADGIVQQPMRIADGMAVVPDSAGSGLDWDDVAIRRYRMD
jgi:mandelate racemase